MFLRAAPLALLGLSSVAAAQSATEDLEYRASELEEKGKLEVRGGFEAQWHEYDNLDMRLLSEESDQEILVSGPNVMQGYLDDEEATSHVIDEGGWFHTGDLGEFTPVSTADVGDSRPQTSATAGRSTPSTRTAATARSASRARPTRSSADRAIRRSS